MSVSAPSEIGAEFTRAADDLLRGVLGRESVRAEIDRSGWSSVGWDAVVDAGWSSVLLDERHGGLGLGITEVSGIFTAVGRHLLPGPLLDHAIVAPLLANWTSAPAAERLLSATEGARTMTFLDVQARGAAHAKPPRFATAGVYGEVDLVPFGARSDDFVIVAEAGDGRPCVVIVDARTSGVEITETASFDPLTRYSHVSLDGASAEPVLDQGSTQGASIEARLATLRATLRLMIACELSGMARAMLDESVDYARERQQFGKPIGAFQAVQHLLADMCASVLCLDAACEMDAISAAGESGDETIAGLHAKAVASATCRAVAEGALQVHGGIGFTIECDLHRWVQHALALQGVYGDERELARMLGDRLLVGAFEPWG